MAMAHAWILGNLKESTLNFSMLEAEPRPSQTFLFWVLQRTQPRLNQWPMRSSINSVAMESKFKLRVIIPVIGFSSNVKDLIIHIFLDQARDIYDLDNLWEDAVLEEIPKEYYFSDDDGSSTSAGEKGYF